MRRKSRKQLINETQEDQYKIEEQNCKRCCLQKKTSIIPQWQKCDNRLDEKRRVTKQENTK